MTVTAEKPSAAIIMYSDGISLAPGTEVNDSGETITISRGDGPTLFSDDLSTFLHKDGRVAAQLPVWRTLAAMPRGVKLPLTEFDFVTAEEHTRRIAEKVVQIMSEEDAR